MGTFRSGWVNAACCCLGSAFLLIACDPRLEKSRIAITKPYASAPESNRVWAVSQSGALYSMVDAPIDAPVGPGSWQYEMSDESWLAKPEYGVSALTHTQGTNVYERAFVVDTDGVLHVRARDASSEAWQAVDCVGLGCTLPVFGGHTAAAVTDSGSVCLAATDSQLSDGLWVFEANAPPDDSAYEGGFRNLPTSMGAIAPDSPIHVLARNTCSFFVATTLGGIAQLDGNIWREPAPGLLWNGRAATVSFDAELGQRHSLLVAVRPSDGLLVGRLWDGILGFPPQSFNVPYFPVDLGNPYNLHATSPDVGMVDLLAVATDGALYHNRFDGSAWGGWGLYAAPSDTTGAPGPPAAVPGPSAYGSPPAAFFVGEVAADTGYLFAQRFSQAFGAQAQNYLDAQNFSQPNAVDADEDGVLDYGPWSESSLAERSGAMVLAAVRTNKFDPVPSEQQWVYVTASTDDGHHWNTPTRLPPCVGQADCMSTPLPPQLEVIGDPVTTITANGTMLVSVHHIAIDNSTLDDAQWDPLDGCYDAPDAFATATSVYRYDGTFFVRELANVVDLNDIPERPGEEGHFVDHPWITSTSDGRAHLFEQVVPLPVDGVVAPFKHQRYRQRSRAGVWGPLQTFLEDVDGLGPYAAVSGPSPGNSDDQILFALHSTDEIVVCNFDPDTAQCSLVNVTEQLGVSGVQTGFAVPFAGGLKKLRASPFAAYGHPTEPGHFYLAYVSNETGQERVYLTESTDGGVTWSSPQLVDPAESRLQTNISLAVQGDGTVFVQYLVLEDPAGDVALKRVAVRKPENPNVFSVGSFPASPSLNLAKLTVKCGSGPGAYFIGDYHATTGGGSTRVHLIDVNNEPDDPNGTARMEVANLSHWKH